MSRSVLKALEILETLAQTENGLAVSDLAERTGYPISTAHRLLNTLAHSDYVDQDPETRRYYLGTKILTLQAQSVRQHQLVQSAFPRLTQLKQQVNGTVNLGVLNGREIVYLETFVPDSGLGFYSPPGTRMPSCCTAIGKLLLAHLPAERREKVLSALDLEMRTPNSIASLDLLRQQMAHVRESGYAVDDQEYAIGVRCIAAPIRDHRGEVVAGVSVTLPAEQLSVDQIDCTADLVVKASQDVSRALGYRKRS
jgi:IclR family KDG regulon transcriptional repressor